MARIARVVVPGFAHHVTQRGNRRQRTFFGKSDYAAYLDLMAEWCKQCEVAVWAYCLMPNHVHLIVVPESEDGLRRAISEAHRRYTRRINFRQGWRGHLWQGRFASFVMDESYLLACALYVERNSVRAGLCKRATEYPWSSAAAHVSGEDDRLVKARPLLELEPRWARVLSADADAATKPPGGRSAASASSRNSNSASVGPYALKSPDERRRTRRIEYGVPGIPGVVHAMVK